MKKFLVVYMGSPTGPSAANWAALNGEARKSKENEGKTAWMNWAMKNSQAITDHGGPLGKTKLVNNNGISDTKNQLTAYTIVQAESHEAAAKMFVNHPHFTIFPGDSVEIIECLPMPKL